MIQSLFESDPALVGISFLWIFLVIAIGAFAAACSEPGEENKALARAYLQDIVIDRNWAAWNRYFASGLTFNGTQISRQALQATADGMHRGFPDLAMTRSRSPRVTRS